MTDAGCPLHLCNSKLLCFTNVSLSIGVLESQRVMSPICEHVYLPTVSLLLRPSCSVYSTSCCSCCPTDSEVSIVNFSSSHGAEIGEFFLESAETRLSFGRREKTPTPKTRVSIWTLLRTPGRFTTRPLPVHFTTKTSVVRPFSVLSKDEIGPW